METPKTAIFDLIDIFPFDHIDAIIGYSTGHAINKIIKYRSTGTVRKTIINKLI